MLKYLFPEPNGSITESQDFITLISEEDLKLQNQLQTRTPPKRIGNQPSESTTDQNVNYATLYDVDIAIGYDGISGLPLELHLEIVSYLPADDLLRLSRVCHSLRDTFLSKLNRKAWTICLSNAGAPPCPGDLTEPKYASLLFDTHCEFCGVLEHSNRYADVQTYYELRKRLCSPCFYCDGRVDEGIALVRSIDENLGYDYDIYTLVPHSEGSLPTPLLRRKYYKSDFTKAVKGYQDAKLIGSDALSAYVKEMHCRREAIVEHCILIREWEKIRKDENEAKKEEEASKRARSRMLQYTTNGGPTSALGFYFDDDW